MTSILFLIGTILMQLMQMQLSKKHKAFSASCSAFLQLRLDFKDFEKKMTLIADVFWNLQTAKNVVR